MRAFLRFLGVVLLLLLAYLLFFPVPVDPVIWKAPPAPGMTGDFAANDRLAGSEVLFSGACPGCEDVAVDDKGRIYGGAVDGRIIRFETAQATEGTVLAETGGRPLGLDFDTLGNLWVADAEKGLLRIDREGNVKVMANTHNKRPFLFTDDLEVGPDGRIYFSDASDKFGIHQYKYDIMEHRPHGRLLVFDPATGQLDLLLDSLYFANGVAVSPDGAFVLVNETGIHAVRRYWLTGQRQGTSDRFIDQLPGFPDGISSGSDGIYWLTVISPRDPAVDWLMANPPVFRKIVARLPDFLQPAPQRYVCILGLDRNGQVVHNLQDTEPELAQIASVQEAFGYLFLGSLAENGIGRFPAPQR